MLIKDGIPMKIPINEDSPAMPINPYGNTKFLIERLLEDMSSNMDINPISQES